MKVVQDKISNFFGQTTTLAFLAVLDRAFDRINERFTATELSKNFVDATAAAQTFQLPSGFKQQKDFFVVKTDSSVNAVTVRPYGTETIEGSATLSLAAQYAQCLLTFNGGVWYRMDA